MLKRKAGGGGPNQHARKSHLTQQRTIQTKRSESPHSQTGNAGRDI